MMDNIKKLGALFAEMVNNDYNYWKNIPLGHQAFLLMRDSLPLRVAGELTPYTRIVLLDKMLSCMREEDSPRFFKEVREYQLSLFPLIEERDLKEDMDVDNYKGSPEHYVRTYSVADIQTSLQHTLDYLDPNLSMEDYCQRYDHHLKFDPVERSEKWENCIYEVEKECDSLLRGERRGMGFCYSYWSTKKSVLARHGIRWRCPSTMNPSVMFD